MFLRARLPSSGPLRMRLQNSDRRNPGYPLQWIEPLIHGRSVHPSSRKLFESLIFVTRRTGDFAIVALFR